MPISMLMCRPTQPLINVVPPCYNTPCYNNNVAFISLDGVSNIPKINNLRQFQKEKVVLVMGATGTGKSRLSIDLAKCFPSEIINSDKIQVYEGLDIVTNKISKEEQNGIPHHLLGTQNPNNDFTSNDFCDMSMAAIDSITRKKQLPIIAGGSNSYLEALVDDDDYKFRSWYNFCCLWVDVSIPVLDSYVEKRVDQMFQNGMVDELRPFFSPNGDYSIGIRRAIGVPEFDEYFRKESFVDDETKKRLIDEAISEMKLNTCGLARKQLRKIHRLKDLKRWKIHRLDATQVFQKQGHEANKAWKKLVVEPSAMIVAKFLYNSSIPSIGDSSNSVVSGFRVTASNNESAVAAATC